MKETERAKSAYGDYLAMGPGRSLEKLATVYHEQAGGRPHTRLCTLKNWSTCHGWQARIAKFEAQVREKQQDAAEKARSENLSLVRAAKMRGAEALKSGAFKVEDAAALDRLVKLEMQLLGAPLADKHEIANPPGETFKTDTHVTTDADNIRRAIDLAGLLAGEPGSAGEVAGPDEPVGDAPAAPKAA